jgi:hypothetical protein
LPVGPHSQSPRASRALQGGGFAIFCRLKEKPTAQKPCRGYFAKSPVWRFEIALTIMGDAPILFTERAAVFI